jgi:hypothetical protein
LANIPWVSLLAAMLAGMVAKWLLDVFFLRSEMFGLRRRLSDRERDLTDLRHEHGRSLQELKNRLTELDATAKAKAVALASLAAREGELAGLRESERSLSDQVQVAEARVATLSSELAALEQTSAGSRAQASELEAELARAGTREAGLIRDLASIQSVRDVLEVGVRTRDSQIVELAARGHGADGGFVDGIAGPGTGPRRTGSGRSRVGVDASEAGAGTGRSRWT